MPTRIFEADYLRDELDLPYYADAHEGENVSYDSGRWMEYMTCYFKAPDDGKFYSFDWSKGLTENQEDEYPWGYYGSGDEPVECVEVEPYEETVVIKKYRIV